jgi:hypothetical protein
MAALAPSDSNSSRSASIIAFSANADPVSF